MSSPPRSTWRTSSYSAGQDECVQVATALAAVTVRDSKDPAGPQLEFGSAAWTEFAARVKDGALDL